MNNSPTTDRTPLKLIIMTGALAALILVADLMTPLGVAAGVPYVVLVLMGTWYSRSWHMYLLAGFATVLTIIGYFASPAGSVEWIVLLNRMLALFAIWIVAFVGVASRASANRKLESSEQRFQDVAEAATDWFWEMDSELRFSYFSKRLFDATGVRPEILIGTNRTVDVTLDMSGSERGEWNRHIADLDAHRSFQNFEYKLKTGDSFRYVRTSGFPLFGSDGSFQGYRGTGTDITKRKAAELKVIETKAALEEQFARIEGVLDNVSNGIVTIDERGIIESFNPAAEIMFGYSANEIVGENVNILIPEPDRSHHDDYIQSYIDTGEGLMCGVGPREVTALHKSEKTFPLELRVNQMYLGDRRLFVGVLVDITERKRVEAKLRKLSRAVEFSSSAVIITDAESTIEYVNPRFTEITGYTREEAVGENTRLLKSGETPDSVYAEMRKIIASKGEWKGVFHNRKKDGSLYWASNSISAIKDDSGVVTNYISIHEDVTHELELKQQLSYQASHDDLTGLINRSEFERRVERLLSTIPQEKAEHALCFMDLDQFKIINDTCGHIAGDELLKQLSQVLQKVVRNRDTLARIGGDEFGILIEHCSLDQAHRVANVIRQEIEKFQFSWKGQPFRIGISIGLVEINETTRNLTELLKQADAACYMAKDLGRNRIHTYYPEDVELARRLGQMQWVSGINQALEENRFCLYAQAIVPLDGGTERHYELLLRMLSEKGDIIPPNAFLPAAERYDLIGQIDTWVIQNAFTILAANPDFLKQVHFITINLSGPSMANGEFLNSVVSQLKASGIEPSKICFEVTETAAISNLNAAVSFIETLKQVGCHFALDDFGSGLSSFGYLKRLPVDYLKIDGMFVKDMVEDPIDRAMVKSINEIGQVMGMKTIAEFVENDEIKDMLSELGINYAQGYGIEKPRPLEELLNVSFESDVS